MKHFSPEEKQCYTSLTKLNMTAGKLHLLGGKQRLFGGIDLSTIYK